MILTNHRERTRFMRFLVVGSMGAVVDFSILNLLVAVFGVPPVLAQAVSFSAAVVSNYSWNRFWTYPDSRTKGIPRQLLEFASVSVLGLMIRSVIFVTLDRLFLGLFSNTLLGAPVTPGFLSRNLALAVTIGVIMFWNFFVNRYWTFADVE